MWNRVRRTQSPAQRAIVQFCMCLAGICVGMFCIIPAHEALGNVWTMLWAIAAGVFYARYLRIKKEERSAPKE